jgi:DNA polymerase III epsilon subunit-like protein
LARLKTLEKSFETNFYALDTETTGLTHNEPIQVGAVLFEKGLAVKKFN